MESKIMDAKVADAIAGNYNFSIKGVVDEAWETTRGFKQTFWAATLLYIISLLLIFAVIGALGVIFGKLMGGSIDHHAKNIMEAMHGPMMPILVSVIVLTVLFMPIILSLGAGFWMVGINRAGQNELNPMQVFQYFNSKLSLFSGWLFVWLLLRVVGLIGLLPRFLKGMPAPTLLYAKGFFLVIEILLHIYVSVSYVFFTPLVVEKKLSFWQALEASRRSVRHQFIKIVGLMSLVILVLAIPMTVITILYEDMHWIFLGLAVIYFWLAPFALLAMSILYREIFGVARSG